ncbi:eEF1A lysine and N-terminal methyltransferase isoform X1 [Sphaerodactylus townsendi]|uniref:eEF1A lysine and N-terminal methyltransferase isoform X1 n=1 Tax=Sphaerodactylus townsendi TaxID=933632 RepID=UPI002026B0EE|nr:eEF1A lysine and N-terminal methyltransferase isoform X1 [Sphaerodactylus townsendi]XP_048353480.1 eEF1A lysine and N-terminal methyltransferase isoform X1 [Sphaerodactylus townsendi]
MVIKQMGERSVHLRPKMSYLVMNVLQMDFPDGRFQVVLDKGTLDALLTDGEGPTVARAEQMFAEIARVLQFGGRYLCVSLAQAHVLKAALEYFSKEGWMIRIHQASEKEAAASEGEFALPVFVYVMTKMKQVPNSASLILELCVEKHDKPIRFSALEHLIEAVKERQQYALLRSQLNKSPSMGNVSLDLCNKETGQVRYTFHVVHCLTVKVSRDNQFAIFIIPQGRETEWLFGTEEGRKQLAASAGFRRLVTVALHRDQHYEGMETIQAELSEKVMELAPPGLQAQQKVPFLSVGGDIGIRSIQHRGTSSLSGEYIIEDVKGDDARYFRRLIFLSNRNVVQSEARLSSRALCKGNKKPRKKKAATSSDPMKPAVVLASLSIDKSYLCCAHHRAMVAGLSLLKNPECLPEVPIRVLVIGLGGGSLPLFIHDYFSQCTVDVVEIDPAVLEVAMHWFGFSLGDRLKVHIADGLVYVSSLAAEAPSSYDAIMFDVDSKDCTLGMSCPPPAFVEKSFLQEVRALLKMEGIFILNLVCRDVKLKETILAALKEGFPSLYARRIEGEVNEILFCQQQSGHKTPPLELQKSAQVLEQALRQPGCSWDSTYVLADMLEAVQLV